MLGFETIAKRLFGTSNERVIKELKPIVDKINALEPELEALSDAALKARTETFRQALKDGTALDDLLVPAFASIREAAKRTLGQRHFDVQLMGGMVLHQGKISEMKTGEGKTLVSTLTVYLNALSGEGVHVVTVNDYLARRDAEWMGQIYRFMDLSVGCVVPGMNETEKKAAYACDVTYGTNNEFGFDYLRDNMKFNLESMVQRVFNFAIVDEVDSILVDEARTPLVISGPTEDNSALYTQVNEIIPKLVPEDYDKDEKDRAVTLTEAGIEHVEQLLASSDLLQGGGLYDLENVSSVHHVNQALKAHKLFSRDSDYIVKDDSVVIIDEFTGRMMEGRRFSEGLHQALEAKEKVAIQNENQTLASITFQNYFRLYPKLAGMTGTAATEAEEFMDIYGLGVVEVPTHMPVCRTDEDDEVYRTGEEKNDAILDLIEACHKRGQPVLVGTVTIEKSEHLSALLKKRKIKHHVLNARYHEQEAQIIAQAGQCGAITIATNMAGRGTDIQLGGHFDMRVAEEAADIVEESQRTEKIETIRTEITADHAKVVDAGGLYVIGTERHESRRIDNQLRGRAGRQGDPGRSKFFISLEDDLMRIFGSERMDTMLVKLGLEKGECIVHPWINKALEKAQQKVEARNFDIRKNLLKYDDVMNDQRKVIYEQRLELMKSEDVSESLRDMRHEVVENMVIHHIPAKSYIEQWDTEGLASAFYRICNIRAPIADWVAEEGINDETLVERLITASDHKIAEKAANYGPDLMRSIEKGVLLQTLDQHWKEHLQQLDHLRQIVVLRAYAQKDPLNEYKVEAFNLFEAMLDDVREEITMILAHFELQNTEAPPPLVPDEPEMQAVHLNPQTNENEMAEVRQKAMPSRSRQQTTTLDPNDSKTWGRVARNAPCPCGSGRKYKHCHGKIT